MKIQLYRSWVLTDEHPMTAKGTPVLLDLETGKAYPTGDSIGKIFSEIQKREEPLEFGPGPDISSLPKIFS